MPFGISKNLFERIISAVLLLPPVLGAVYMGGWWFAAFLMLGGVLMAVEWVALTSAGSRGFGLLLAALIVAGVAIAEVLKPDALQTLIYLIGVAGFGAVIVRFLSFKKAGWWLIGAAYVGLPLIALWWLREIHGILVLWVLLVVWATDIGGYFAGKGIGGPKLAVKISPKKTWAGLLGGMLLSVLVSASLYLASPFVVSMGVLMILSAGLAVWSQIGDLFESGVKRAFGVKDSGGLIPGHGGLLDRVDGLVFVGPAVAFVVVLLPNLFRVSA